MTLRPRVAGTARIETFSDGVFAMIVTLLILEVHLREPGAYTFFVGRLVDPSIPMAGGRRKYAPNRPEAYFRLSRDVGDRGRPVRAHKIAPGDRGGPVHDR